MKAKQNNEHKQTGTNHHHDINSGREQLKQEVTMEKTNTNEALAGGAEQRTAMERDPATINEVLSRLKKIEGQVRGVQRMVQDYRSCGDIVIQLTAIKAAVNQVGITMLGCHLADHIKYDLHEGRDIKESLSEFMDIFKKFS